MKDYFVLVEPWATYVKDANFFRAQRGHLEPWGEKWIHLSAYSIEEARALAPKIGKFPCAGCGCRCGSCDSAGEHDNGCPGPYVHRGIAEKDGQRCDALTCWCHGRSG